MQETVRSCLRQIAAHNKTINAFVSNRAEESILNTAHKALQSGLPLAGLPIALKANFATKNETTSCSSRILQDFKSPYNAHVVSLLEAAGASIIGKTNMDEFGMGSANIYSANGPALNPHSHRRVAGGSSGGSAAAVASGMAKVALGSDTGGSVRLPASYCGVVGMKPSYGLVSRWGLVPYANSLDTVGIIADTVQSAQNVFEILNQYDERDPTTLPQEYRSRLPPLDSEQSLAGIKIGIPDEFNVEELDESIRTIWSKGMEKLSGQGAEMVPISLPMTKHALSAYYIIAPAEAASNLAKYDGIRYGHRAESLRDEQLYAETRGEGFGAEVVRRILLGNFTLSEGSYGDYYVKAQKLRRLLVDDYSRVFKQPHVLFGKSPTSSGTVDAIMTPSAISAAPTLKSLTSGNETAVSGLVSDVMTVPASLAGIPAMSVPFDNVPTEDVKMPIGLQVMTQYGDEAMLFRVAHALESRA